MINNTIDTGLMAKYSPEKQPQAEHSGVKISELQLYTVKESVKKDLFAHNAKQTKLKKINNKRYPLPHQKSKEELWPLVLESVSIENFRNQKYHPKRKLCELSQFEKAIPSPIEEGIVPSSPANYLEMQRNIKNSNPILWLIKNKHRLDKEKKKLTPSAAMNATNTPSSLPKIEITNDPAMSPSLKQDKNSAEAEAFGHLIHWKKGERIHIGQSAFIYKALNLSCGNVFIVKEYKDDKLSLAKYQNEAKYLKSLSNAHIVNFLGAEVYRNKRYIYLEYVSGGNLRSFISKFGCLNETIIKRFIKQILSALEYIHIQGFLHGNIKMSSILVDCDGSIKLGDFSCASIDNDAFKNNVIEEKSDINKLGTVISEIIGDPTKRELSPLFLDYIEYFSNKELSVNYCDLKNHPFLK